MVIIQSQSPASDLTQQENNLNIEKAIRLGKKGEELKDLSNKLKGLAVQFQILEERADEISDW